MTQSYGKNPLHRQNIPKGKLQYKNATKTSITQLLRIYLGWSAGVTTATQLVWLNLFTEAQPSHQLQKLCNQKDTFLIICK